MIVKNKLILKKEKTFKYDYKLCNTSNTLDFLQNIIKLQQEPEEVIILITMDIKNNIVGFFEVARGVLDTVGTSAREVFKRVFVSNANSFILAHNHVTGDIKPSAMDELFTENIKDTSEILNVKFLDHLIIGDNKYYSFAERMKI